MATQKRTAWSAWLWLLLAFLYLFLPLIAMAWSAFTNARGEFYTSPFSDVFAAPEFAERFFFSFRSAIFTILISALLVVPTAYWVQLRMPRMRPVIEFLTVVPLVIPALLMTFGLIRLFNNTPFTNSNQGLYVMLLGAYVIISFPFMYRSVDAGMASINIRTLTEAAQSLGAGWFTILFRVIFPNLLVAILNGAFITFAIVLGEFTVASLLNQPAFSPYMLDLSSRQGDQATALGIITFLLTWVCIATIQVLGRGRGRVAAV
jgi:putative spermidine/putrescine transport system permease protein